MFQKPGVFFIKITSFFSVETAVARSSYTNIEQKNKAIRIKLQETSCIKVLTEIFSKRSTEGHRIT